MDALSQFLSSLLSQGGTGLTPFEILSALALAYIGGVLSSLTPCVYPMIPITVSVVGGSSNERRSWKLVMIRGLAYVFGMTLVYSFLGVLAGLTGKVFGSFTNTPGWYIGLGVTMSLAALVMLEIIPFDPLIWADTFKRRVLGKKPKHHSAFVKTEMTLLGAFALGASSGFIAAPCTTPVLTSILAFIAKTQSVFLGLGLMVMFSLGLGTLLLLIATFAGALQLMPRSGTWMKWIKLSSGILLLLFADYLFYRSGQLGGI